jgi:hypothetical protein
MMRTEMHNQRGISLASFMISVVVIVLVAISVLRVVPAYLQNKTIKTTFDEITHRPDIKSIPLSEIKSDFMRRAMVSEITAIKLDEVDITKEESGVTLSATYSVKISLFGNVSLLLEFNPSSSSSSK